MYNHTLYDVFLNYRCGLVAKLFDYSWVIVLYLRYMSSNVEQRTYNA